MTVITGHNIDRFRMFTLLAGLKLEIKGMKRRGESCYSIIKREWELKGSKADVLRQFSEIVSKT